MSTGECTNGKALRARLDEDVFDISVEETPDAFRVQVGDESFTVHRRSLDKRGLTSLLINNRPYQVLVERHPSGFFVSVGGSAHNVEILDPLSALAKRAARQATGPGIETIVAPMPGVVISVEVSEGDRVESGTPLVVVEAMKMQNELAAGNAGVVRQIKVQPGQKVDTRDVLVVLDRA
jgi:biotin carboxyl carrier protein